MDVKKIKVPVNVFTVDSKELEKNTGNTYKSIIIIAKRANQINSLLKEELNQKLSEFNSTIDNLEEVFENPEQIEVSKYYEKLPKAHSIALKEFLDDKLYWRYPDHDKTED